MSAFFSPSTAVSQACLCQFPDAQSQGFLAVTGWLLFTNNWVINKLCTPLFTMEKKQEAWLILVLCASISILVAMQQQLKRGLWTSRVGHWNSVLHKQGVFTRAKSWGEEGDVLSSHSIKESVSNLLDYTPWPATPNPLLNKSRIEFFLLSLLLTGLLTQVCSVLCGKAHI